jgi:O-antigen/teichoic acid export membrane protein
MPVIEDKTAPRIADSRVVARNVLWSLAGRAGPMIVAFLLTPKLVHAFGPSRWGVFTIALSLTGMMGMFDFGVGRALTRAVAVKLGAGEGESSASSVMTGIVALTVFGVSAVSS